MRHRRFTPAFDGLSLRIAPSSLVGATTADLASVALVAAATTSSSGVSAAAASSSATSTDLSALGSAPYTCAVPTTAVSY
jgi:hypothetical protein